MPKDAAGHLIPGACRRTRTVPASIPRPEYVGQPRARAERRRRRLHARRGRADPRGRAHRRGRRSRPSAPRSGPGVTTDELDAIAHEFVVAHGAYPSTLGYRGYPKSSCTSRQRGDLPRHPRRHGARRRRHRQHRHHRLQGRRARRPQRDVPRRRRRARRPRCWSSARARRSPAASRPSPPAARSTSSAGRSSPTRSASATASCATSPATGSAALPLRPRHPALRRRPEFDTVMEPGMVFTIEPMLTLGTIEWDVWADDWTVVTRDRAHRAVRAHPRRHRARRRDPDPALASPVRRAIVWRHGD